MREPIKFVRHCGCLCKCQQELEGDDLARCRDCVDGFHSWEVPSLPSKRVDRFAFFAGAAVFVIAAIYFTAHVLAAYALCPRT